MRGSPLLQLLGLVIALGLLAFPLHYLTSATRIETLVSNSDATPSNVRQVELKLVSSAVPYSFEIQFLGKPLCTGTGQQATDTRTARTPFPPEQQDRTLDTL